MDLITGPLLSGVLILISLYTWILIIAAILSWLIAFNVVNTRNRFVYVLYDMSFRLTEPALRPLRRIIPSIGGIDISFIILFVLLRVLEEFVVRLRFALL